MLPKYKFIYVIFVTRKQLGNDLTHDITHKMRLLLQQYITKQVGI